MSNIYLKKQLLLTLVITLFSIPAIFANPFTDSLTAPYQTRDSGNNIIITQKTIQPQHIGIVVIDMWNFHWCKTSAARVACMVPRMNKCLQAAREMGMQVFLCPTDVANNYAALPQRQTGMSVQHVTMPKSLNIPCPHPGSGGCQCGADECINNGGWSKMADGLLIDTKDIISSGPEELYALCKERGITQLWYMGVHTNNCVLGKPEGMRNMMNLGLKCALVRDLQDPETFYDPIKNITPDDNNARVVAHFEKYLAPSINFGLFLQQNNLWEKNWIVDPVRITPWGKPERPQQFRDTQIVTLTTPQNPGVNIRFTTDGSEPNSNSPIYTKPFAITQTTLLKTIAYKDGVVTNIKSTGYFTKLPPAPPLPDVYISASGAVTQNRVARDPQTNKSIRKTTLKIHNQVFKKGVGTQAPSFVTYALKPGYKAFVASCGIDDFIANHDNGIETAQYPDVVFKIFIDGKLMAESPTMRNSQWAWAFNVPIPTDSRVLTLVAESKGVTNLYDFADWVNAGFLVK